MHLVVGLGNPGPRYAKNRHNVGFMVVEALGAAAGASFREKFSGRFAKVSLRGRDVVLLEPGTFMNRSGDAVREAMGFFRVPLADLLVVHDELDLAFGTVKLKQGGGTAGHNGLRSIVAQCGGPEFARLRVGIGRPEVGTVHDWVLSDFSPPASAELPSVLDEATRAVEAVIVEGISAAMNTVNARAKAKPKGAEPN